MVLRPTSTPRVRTWSEYDAALKTLNRGGVGGIWSPRTN